MRTAATGVEADQRREARADSQGGFDSSLIVYSSRSASLAGCRRKGGMGQWDLEPTSSYFYIDNLGQDSWTYHVVYMSLYRVVWGNGDGRFNSIPKTVNLIGGGGPLFCISIPAGKGNPPYPSANREIPCYCSHQQNQRCPTHVFARL
jgi:hypothetical protein